MVNKNNKFSHILSYIILFCIMCVFNGCVSFNKLKENIKYSLHSQHSIKNSFNDNYIQSLYDKNFVTEQITTIHDNKLSLKQGNTGYVLSYKFLTENGGGLYFLNKYDPNKEIVLLVHGAKGNGVNWKYLINNLDKRFQPLIVSYPSGVNLNISANIITRKLENLFLKYKISNFNIIAHSMGGLVAKQIINNLNHNKYKINTFITLSTPWGGHEAATKTKDLPYSIPSWHDMIPNSEFIVNLKNKYNSLSVNHYLLFGYKGNSTIYSRDNDGVISLKSQLNYYDQVNAKKVYGFNETHISILQSDRVFNMINIILNDKLK